MNPQSDPTWDAIAAVVVKLARLPHDVRNQFVAVLPDQRWRVGSESMLRLTRDEHPAALSAYDVARERWPDLVAVAESALVADARIGPWLGGTVGSESSRRAFELRSAMLGLLVPEVVAGGSSLVSS